MTVKISDKYELNYWIKHRSDEHKCRSGKMLHLFDLPNEIDICADVGCGPWCGIFQLYKSTYMYAVDPLWSAYFKNNLQDIPPGVVTVSDCAEKFNLPQNANIIISVNSLDHSGSLKNSIYNIMSNLVDNGLFYLHIHMRTKKQLNSGHKMSITEDNLDSICSSWVVLQKNVYDQCPIENKPYKTYVAIMQNSPRI